MKDYMPFIRQLFYKKGRKSLYFQRMLIGFNVLFLFLLFIEFIIPQNSLLYKLEIGLGIIFVLEFLLRCISSKKKYFGVLHWIRILDLITITSIFIRPYLGEDLFILHLIGGLRILRFYRTLDEIFRNADHISRYRDVITSSINLFAFIFIMTSLVYGTQKDINAGLNSYIDALYFTITTLTTTGYGDITAVGNSGKILVVFIMIFGVGLFVNLATKIFRPRKIYFKCDHCGLNRHERDASHCKHCGNIVKIEIDGEEV